MRLQTLLPCAMLLEAGLMSSVCIAASFSGGDGLSLKSAVQVEGVQATSEIDSAELDWIAIHYPGGKANMNARRFVLYKRVCQSVPVVLSDGSGKVIFFDLTQAIEKP